MFRYALCRGNFDLPARSFDRLRRRSGSRVDLDRERDLDLALGEQLHRARATDQALLLEPRAIDHRVRRDIRQLTGIEDLVFDTVMVREAALRQTPLNRHLTAFKPRRDAAARTRLVALVALASGAAEARCRTLAAALPIFCRARIRADLSK
jgi:hypothetical protein